MKYSGFALLVALALLVPPSFVAAQGLGGTDELVVALTPERPGPNQTVTVDVESYSADLSAATIVYQVNGIVQEKGIGQKHFTFRTGKAGSATVLTIVAQTPDGRTLSKEFTLRPAKVLLLWQANGYTPPFYRGKALFPFEGTVFIAAFPLFQNADGSRVDPQKLIYTWKEDDTTAGDASGYGRSTFAIKGGVPMRTKTVSVEVHTQDNLMLAQASVDIEPVASRIILYENHPLYGVLFNHALTDSLALEGDEVSLAAVPFYFEAGSRQSPLLSYEWQANYAALPSETKPNIVLRRTGAAAGDAALSLKVAHSVNTFEEAAAMLRITFGEQAFAAPASDATSH